MTSTPGRDQSIFESSIQALEAEIANVGVHLNVDAAARHSYARQIREMANELRVQASSGRTSWAEAASQAQEMRNTIMEIVRGRCTPIGRALAESLKREGKTLNELIARKAQQLYGPTANFSRLSPSLQSKVYFEVVRAAGKSNPKVTAVMRTASRAGRGLIVLSMALFVYQVATAQDKAGTAKRELVSTGAGVGGGILGGAVAGLACGPGAPVCVAVGAFVGGALAAFGVDFFW